MSTRDPSHPLRKRAYRRGLRITKRGAVFSLHKGNRNRLLCSGSELDVEQYLDRHYPSPQHYARRKAAAELPSGWESAIDNYCRHLAAAGQSGPTINLRRDALTYMARGLGHPPEQVTGDDLVDWFAAQEWQPETRRSYRGSARGFFAWAYRTGQVPDYLGDHIPSVRIPPPIPLPVPDQAWRDALAAADRRALVMLRLAAEAGLRRGEVARVRIRDLTEGVGGPQLIVHGKGNKIRVVPISDSLADLIRTGSSGHTPELAAFGTNGYLFPGSQDGHLTVQYVGDIIRRLLPPGYTMHKLRHRFATRAYRGTRNLRAVQVLLGHSSVATTERYTAVDDDEIRAAMMAAIYVQVADAKLGEAIDRLDPFG
jgi:integrase